MFSSFKYAFSSIYTVSISKPEMLSYYFIPMKLNLDDYCIVCIDAHVLIFIYIVIFELLLQFFFFFSLHYKISSVLA